MMNIEHLIEEILTIKAKNTLYLDNLLHFGRDEKKFIDTLQSIPDSLKNDWKLISLVADKLQLINDESIFEQFTLNDIKILYETNVKNNPENLSVYEDIIEFLINVMDDKTAAQDYVLKAYEVIHQKENYLKEVLIRLTE